jgi:hypothetical protein
MVVDRLQFVNPLALDDSIRSSIDSIRRLLEYERFLDRMELIKGEQGSLPWFVEQRIKQSVVQSALDARNLARATLDAGSELEDVGAFEQIVLETIKHLDEVGELSSDEILAEGLPFVEEFLANRGLPSELWQWGLKYVDLTGITLSSDIARIIARRDDRSQAMIPRNPAYLATVSGTAFVEDQLYRNYVANPDAIIDGIPHISPYGSILVYLKSVVEDWENRAHTTALHGLQVLPTGIIPGLILVVAIALIIGGIVLAIRCEKGETKGDICQLPTAMIILGAIGLCLFFGCTVKNEKGQEAEIEPIG